MILCLQPIIFTMDYDRLNFEFLTGLILKHSWVCLSLLQDGGDNFLLYAFGFFLLVFGQILAGDALARFLNHVRVCSKARLGHDAPFRGLEVSSCLSIEVTTETNRSSSQQRRSKDLGMFAIKKNHELLLDSMDSIYIVFEPLDVQNFQSIDIADDLDHTRLDFNDLLLTIQVHLNPHVSGRDRSHEDLSNTSENLNFLGDTLEISSHNGNGESFSGVFEEKMEAVVHLVVVSLAIESADGSGCNMASSRKLGKPIESNKQERSSQRKGENTFKEDRDTNVPDFVPAAIVLNDQLGFSTNMANLSDNFQISSRHMTNRSLNQVTNKQSFENISNVGNNKVIDWGFTQVTGNNQFSANLINRSSLVAD